MSVEVLTRWYGAYAVEAGKVIAARPFPPQREALLERWALRRAGHLAPEEEALVAELRAQGKTEVLSRDRRLSALGVGLAYGHTPEVAPPVSEGVTYELGRELLLEQSRRDLELSFDPSVHLEEAVRSLEDLDETLNLLGERLASWRGRERPEELGPDEAPRTVAEALVQEEVAPGPARDPTAPGPELAEARKALADLWLKAETLRRSMERAVETEAPVRFPNLNELLGPLLTARLLSQAGGLSRMARMPASTIQVLGAERAFFEHLRGRGPPPRHGLLFLHPQVHTAPRAQRGRIARALAGKVAIAARRDQAGTPPLPELKASLDRRLAEIRRSTPEKGSASRPEGPGGPRREEAPGPRREGRERGEGRDRSEGAGPPERRDRPRGRPGTRPRITST